MTPLVSISEAVALLRELGYDLTPRQIRYLGIEAARRGSDGKNGGRLFDAEDVALLTIFADLLARCREWELPSWSARAAIVYRERELRRALSRRSPRFLIVDAARGTATLSETNDRTQHAIDLRAMAARVSTEMRRYRREQPDIWNGAALMPFRELATV